MAHAWHKYLIYISLGFLVIALAQADYLKIPQIYSTLDLSFSFLMLFLGFIINAIAQQRLLTRSGFPISISQSISMVGLNMFGKYIPGKMWIALGKAAYVADRSHYKVVDLSILFVRAQFIGVWCGLLLGIIGLMINDALDYLSWIGLSALTGLTLILFSKSANAVAEKLLNKFSKNRIVITTLSFSTTTRVFPFFMGSWVLWGLGFYLMTSGIINHDISVSTAFGFPLAGTLGILFLLAPGGVGIREGLIVGYLSMLEFSLTESIIVAAASRLWFLIGEFFIFVIGLICERLSTRVDRLNS